MCMHVQPSRSPRLPPGPPPCRVRVVGGAYGGFCDFDTHSGMFTYSSYRDPNLLKTVDVYDGGRRHTRRAAVVMNHGARAAPQLRARTGCEHQARPPVWMLPGSRAAWGCGPCTRPPARGACIWFVTGAPKLELANPRCCLLPPAQAPSTSSPRWRCLTTSWPRPSSAPSATSTPTSCPVRRDAGVGPFAITDSLACGRAHRARFLATPSRPEPPCTAARARAHACLAPSSPRFPPRLQGPHRLHAPHPGRDRRGAPAAQVGQGWAGPGPLGPPFGDAVPAPLQVPPAFPSPTAPCSCCPDHSGCAAQFPPPPPLSGTRSWPPRCATSASLARCWRRYGTRARWWPSLRVSPPPPAPYNSVHARSRARWVVGWHAGAARPLCRRASLSGYPSLQSALFLALQIPVMPARLLTLPPSLPPPLAADKLEAAHAERPGFFAAVKKVV